jgi:hypothetical protein
MTSASERTRRWAASALLALVLGAHTAHAEPSAVERETARSLLLSGREKRASGRLDAALEDFEKAHAIMGVPTTALDLGKAQEELGRLVEARTTYLEAARVGPTPREPPAFTRARAEAKRRADALAPRLATLTVHAPRGAALEVDGRELPPASVGAPIKLNPGRHAVVAKRDGHEERASVTLAEGSSESIELHLPDGDGAKAQAAPTRERTSDRSARDSGERPTEAPPRRTETNPLVWVGLGTAVVAGGVGATTGLLAFDTKADVAARCDGGVRCPPSTYDDLDRGERLGTISTVAFVVAGVGAAIMTYGLLYPARSPTATTGQRGESWILGPTGVAGTF